MGTATTDSVLMADTWLRGSGLLCIWKLTSDHIPPPERDPFLYRRLGLTVSAGGDDPVDFVSSVCKSANSE